ncbi:hypothetical protein [Poseidonibacter antarcticus]|uniref:hypothetical protein n=1 Tax=Poseidonibacter antarcticus TaxID=2478538 RepID=UPI000EF4E0FD|nr:hypothetical protein [Poseidonibacter antarcticus]
MNRLFVNKTKTIALLIYVRSTLEQLFTLIEQKEYALKVLTPEDSKTIIEHLEELLKRLKESEIMNDSIFRNTVNKCKGPNTYYEELVTYYNSIVIQIEHNMKNGDLWIPEQFTLCLLSEWLLEEKHTQYFSYLNDIDYLGLLSKFETIDIEENKEYRLKVSQMYMISSQVIKDLKAIKYQTSTKKSKKKR